MFNQRFLYLFLLSIASSVNANDSEALPPFQTYKLKPSQMDFGGVGLMQMPTARMSNEGEFFFNYTKNSEYAFYTFSLQVMPWLESTIRYTEVQDLLYSNDESFSGDTKYADKGIDAKLRLIEESDWFPETSIGIRDIGGTGLFDGEFISFTKHLATESFGQFDFTLGLGWGYLGQSGNITNPFCSYSNNYCTRDTSFNDNGGSIDSQRWFKGNAALFGGIEYQTNYHPLRLKVEYDGNDYTQDIPVTNGNILMEQDSPWNYGIVYGLSDYADLRVSYERGNTITLGISLSTNFNNTQPLYKAYPSLDKNFVENVSTPKSNQSINWKELEQSLFNHSGYDKNEFYIQNSKLTLLAEQNKYRDRDEAQDKASSILNDYLPNTITQFNIIEKVNSLPISENVIDRENYINYQAVNYINPKTEDFIQQSDQVNLPSSSSAYQTEDNFSYGFSPALTQTLGSAEDFYLYSIGTKFDSSYWFASSWQLDSSIYFNLLDNYDKFNYTVPDDNTSNPRVRTLAREYIHDNHVYLTNLQLSNFQKYSHNWYQQTYLGYLEQMFAGFGSELLYRRKEANWAIGLDWNIISQRDPNSWLSTYNNPWDYSDTEEVLSKGTTGHMSIYYRPEWSLLKDTLFQLDYGKFLAGDVGLQLEFSKQFDSGIIVGAYASKTDMSAEEFGEGSFTKGFYFTVPFDILTVKPNSSRANFHWQPLTRDGGQKLNKQNYLYEITDQLNPWYERPVKH
ncbi:putative OtnG protein [Marinomonas sp. MED121]|uniref:YjbH domain-containing protein n=1 Tax=Marinomonas sp. MED121 TaxID=314277 RepID=UPI000069113C|nr:YjbH domain-containing protein [Marinomonas sp. MED121]EAQ67262.1 putative OtnG protein [Marinomonas sp. MED121]